MLGLLSRENEYVFRKGMLKYFQEGFLKHREKLAAELNEPEILKCSFKTFRTFYGTKCSYKFRDPFEVKYRMGHVQLKTTELYIRREQAMSYEYTSLVTHTIEEAKQAIEDGFEYITDQDNVKIWRKPK
jgi:integrase